MQQNGALPNVNSMQQQGLQHNGPLLNSMPIPAHIPVPIQSLGQRPVVPGQFPSNHQVRPYHGSAQYDQSQQYQSQFLGYHIPPIPLQLFYQNQGVVNQYNVGLQRHQTPRTGYPGASQQNQYIASPYNIPPLTVHPQLLHQFDNLTCQILHHASHFQVLPHVAPSQACNMVQRKLKDHKNIFSEYFTLEQVTHGIKRGTLIEDNKSDILVCGLSFRNRAFNGDIVAVQLMEEDNWRISTFELQLLEASVSDKESGLTSDSDQEIKCEDITGITNDISMEQTSNNTTTRPSQSSQMKSGRNGVNEILIKQSLKKDSGSNEGNKIKIKQNKIKQNISLKEFLTGDSPAKKKLEIADGKQSVKNLFQRTGKVVAILKKKHSRVCAGYIKPMANTNLKSALFYPHDSRVPRMIIPLSDCPANFLNRPDDYSRTLYVCRHTNWRLNSMYADGSLVKNIGQAGEIDAETEGMLIENNVDFDEFSKEIMDSLPKQSPWCIPALEIASRRDYRTSCVFTIDPSTAKDLDDALSCEEIGNGRFKVGVHIADVSYFVKEKTVLDEVAARRSTSVYLVHKMIPMLPKLLCEQLCSLNPGQDRLTFSVEWIITEQGEIEDKWFGRSIIRSCVQLTYDHVQGIIEQPDRQHTQKELPKISKNFSVDDIKRRIINLNKIAVNLREGRHSNGALRLDQIKLQYSLDSESGLPNGYCVYQYRDSNKLVEEFMLLANMSVAHQIKQRFPDKALLRRHPPPQERMLGKLEKQLKNFGIVIDTSSAGAIQRSLNSYSGEDEYSKARLLVLTTLCAKAMQTAKYFCTGSMQEEVQHHHYALNVSEYTHFTSPIRRYPDIIVHRLLAASLGYCDSPSLHTTQIQTVADYCNDKKTSAKLVDDLSIELFFAVFVKTVGTLEEKAMVMSVLDKSFDILVPKLGVKKRVYCDKLPIKEMQYEINKGVSRLKLIWKAEGQEPELQQDIEIFTMVDCVIQVGDSPSQWTAIIKRPLVSFIQSCTPENLCIDKVKQLKIQP